MRPLISFVVLVVPSLLFVNCGKNGDFLLFSVGNDRELGEKVAEQIANDPSFEILSRTRYSTAYDYLDNMLSEILDSEEIAYRDEFDWTINILKGADLNAFVTPGGQVYVYTGLIFFLDKEDDLAGVLGHEVAHADRRHGSKQLQRQYGISTLLSIVTGEDTSVLEQVVGQVAGTGAVSAFNRNAEAEADDYSVRYLASTQYACNGATAFFRKLGNRDKQASAKPEFLKAHPDPGNRAEDIDAIAASINCSTVVGADSVIDYQAFRNLL